MPPSANEIYETNVTKVWKQKKGGGKYLGFKTSRRRADCLIEFQLKCQSFKNCNLENFRRIQKQCIEWINQGYVLRLDSFFVFENSRVWTKAGHPQQMDADNRRKPLQDAVTNLIGIDDKWVFSGNIEKATCDSKEYEQCIARITPTNCRSLNQIKALRNTAAF